MTAANSIWSGFENLSILVGADVRRPSHSWVSPAHRRLELVIPHVVSYKEGFLKHALGESAIRNWMGPHSIEVHRADPTAARMGR
jgi:hypothetical protein